MRNSTKLSKTDLMV